MVLPQIEKEEDSKEDSPPHSTSRYDVTNNESSRTGSSLPPINPMRFYVGQRIDVLDSVNRWSEAEVLEVDNHRHRVYVSYLYWSRKWDEWIPIMNPTSNRSRIAPLHTHTYQSGGVIKVGQRLEVQDLLKQCLEAFVLETRQDEVLIHYKDFGSKYDEWLPRNSPRISAFGTHKQQPHHPSSSSSSSLSSSLSFNTKHSATCPQDTVSKQRSIHQFKVPDVELIECKSDLERKRQIAELSDRYTRYISALSTHGLSVAKVVGDGNCLFRSVSHQIYGDDRYHSLIRQKCVDYMETDASFFSQFVEGGLESFSLYLAAKRLNACWGDDPEIQALSEIYGRPIEIWASDSSVGARKLRTFHETTVFKSRPHIRLSYYGGGHYDSLVSSDHNTCVVLETPGVVEDRTLALQSSRGGCGGNNKSLSDADVVSDESVVKDDLTAALLESRAEAERWGADDIEHCLSLSLALHEESKVEIDDYVADDSRAIEAAELMTVQGELLDSVVAESERDFIESSMQEALLAADGRVLQSEEDAEIESVMRLSTLSEEEALQLAIQISMNQAGSSSSNNNNHASSILPANSHISSSSSQSMYSDDEELLKQAIAASLAQHNCGNLGVNATSSSSINDSDDRSFHAIIGVADDEEELQRAIAASLRHQRPS